MKLILHMKLMSDVVPLILLINHSAFDCITADLVVTAASKAAAAVAAANATAA